ncbi:synaptonemal complex protein 2-like [Euphorbia lathyris]|uniref:synaptonemal complex protein 2-like n=1 Tax=Euphorbia lathyris TaxID=212925 RepID=UPI003313C4BE
MLDAGIALALAVWRVVVVVERVRVDLFGFGYLHKTMQLRNENDVQMKALWTEHEDECKRLQEELNLQKTKEDRQRALLQLQWKVMSDKPRNDQEVTSKEVGMLEMTRVKG